MSIYDKGYYHSQLGPIPYERGVPGWEQFFGNIADHIVHDLHAKTVLDVGAGIGFLVEHLSGRGVDAVGIDISKFAASQSSLVTQVDLMEYDPMRLFDLVVCIEVLEHLEHPHRAVDRICKWSTRVLFSSTPHDYNEPTHKSVLRPSQWALAFATNGLHRDIDYDASYISEWAVLYDYNLEVPDVIHGYEERLYDLETRSIR